MTQAHLLSQFDRIYQHFQGEDAAVTLQYMSEILCCTKRNARTVLNKMTEIKWLNWEPVSGRGNKSLLTFLLSTRQIKKQRVEYLFKQNKLKVALEELDFNKELLTQLMIDQFGVSNIDGHCKLTIAASEIEYHTDLFSHSDPIIKFIHTLVFNRLTKFNRQTKQVEGELAHRWQMLSTKHWRFYLRSNVLFHDHSYLSEQDIISSFEDCKKLNYFSHIQDIQSPSKHCIDFHLSIDDANFPIRLAHPNASIYKKTNIADNEMKIGTGAFYLNESKQSCSNFKRFDRYYNKHSLIDEIEIWSIKQKDKILLSHPINLNETITKHLSNNLTSKGKQLNKGSICLITNRNTGLAINNDWSDFFKQLLSSKNSAYYFNELDETSRHKLIPAAGIMTKFDLGQIQLEQAKVLKRQTIRLAYLEDLLIFHDLAKLLKEKLEQHGHLVSLQAISNRNIGDSLIKEGVDILLCQIELETDNTEELLIWLNNCEYLSLLMPSKDMSLLKDFLLNSTDNLDEINQYLLQTGQVIPIAHFWEETTDLTNILFIRDVEEIVDLLWIASMPSHDKAKKKVSNKPITVLETIN